MRARDVQSLKLPGAGLVLVASLASATACASPTVDQPNATLTALHVTPANVDLTPPATQQYSASGEWSDGSSAAPSVTWTASGGTISGNGLYTAGSTGGAFHVIASYQSGTLTDTAQLLITPPPPVLTAVVLHPANQSLTTGATQQFSVTGNWSDGSHAVPAVNYSATGGTITAGGLYTAGATAGTFRVIAVQQGGTLADTAAITLTQPPPTLTQVILSPPSATIGVGTNQQFSVTGNWSDGSHAVPAVNYLATGGTVTAGGLYTAGATAGTFRVIAVQQGGTLADTAAITLTVPPPTLTQVILSPASASIGVGTTQQFSVTGNWSDGTHAVPLVNYSATGGTVTAGGLYTAGGSIGSYRVVATQQGGTLADTAVVTLSHTYTDSFATAENPLSEAGRWIHLDNLLTPCKTVGGQAFGTQVVQGLYDDSSCYLTGFGNNYEVEGTVWLNPSLSGQANREIEILMRWSDNGILRSTLFGDTHANGYEINVQHAGEYMQLGRFKGALLTEVDHYAVPQSGDKFRVRIEGQRIRVWWNDVLKIDYTDNDPLQITTGNPGIGFFVSGAPNTDFGFDVVTVTQLP